MRSEARPASTRSAPSADSATAIEVGEPNGFGIYVHWPFCAAKCPYCDFNSHVRAKIDEPAWTQGIQRELEWFAGYYGTAHKVETVFFGGGTPSLVSGSAIAGVLDKIAALWPLMPDAEITLESNPASAEAQRFRDYRAAGVNRLSLGVQALNDADLRFLGRLHDVGEAKVALKMAIETFEHVSLDLIYARPGQTVDDWRSELSEALAFGTEHLSLYQLTIEPGTPFATLVRAGRLATADEDIAAALFETTQDMTNAAGVPAYEISNHARPGAECRHNLLYWRYGDYVGVGPGAHGRFDSHGRRMATVCEKLPERWQEKVLREGNGIAELGEIGDREAAREHLLMNLRLSEGLDLEAFGTRWNHPIPESRLVPLLEAGLLERVGSHVRATARGRIVLNAVLAEIAD